MKHARITQAQRWSRTARRGFTLIETLIVVMLASLLISAAATLLVNFTVLRAQPVEAAEFEVHSQNVRRFLDACFAGDGLDLNALNSPPPTGKPSEASAEAQQGAVRLGYLPDRSRSEAPKIEMLLPGDSPLLRAPTTLARTVTAQLHYIEREGLFLVWYLPDSKRPDSRDLIYHRLLSPWVVNLHYAYYDREQQGWSIEDALRQDLEQAGSPYTLPDCLLIDFQESENRPIVQLPIYLKSNLAQTDAP